MNTVRQLVVFAITGVTATLVHVCVGASLHYLAGVPPFAANLVAFFSAAGVTMFGNSRIAFAGRRKQSTDLFKAASTILLGLVLNQTIVVIVTDVFALPYEVALVAIIATVPAITFILFKFWAFRGG